MILVFVTNERFGEVTDLPLTGRVSYRNPKYVRSYYKPEKCDAVYIHGDYPELEEYYKGKVINFDSKALKSEYPKEKGAGWYELSNGEAVRGKEKAIQAESEI